MRINLDKCIVCQQCAIYCPVDCIHEVDNEMIIDENECVECGNCLRHADCPTDALEQPFLQMPRALRKAFSDPLGKHENTELKHEGRGTEEIKTNDVTGIVHDLENVVVAIEMGRPGVGARFSDVEKITKTLSRFNVKYEKNNPVTILIADKSTGRLDPSILNEKILSCIVEFMIKTEELEPVIGAIKEVSTELNTVFSMSVISKIDNENTASADNILLKHGINLNSISAKTNMGLGKPLYEERIAKELGQ